MVGGIEKDIIIEMWKIVNLESVRELIEKKVSVFFLCFQETRPGSIPRKLFCWGKISCFGMNMFAKCKDL